MDELDKQVEKENKEKESKKVQNKQEKDSGAKE